MNIKTYLPSVPQVSREAITVLAGVLIAAYIISRFPKLKTFVEGNSLTVQDPNKNVYFG